MKSSAALYTQIVDDVFNAIQHARRGNRVRTVDQWLTILGYVAESVEAHLFRALYTKHAPRCIVDVDTNRILHVVKEDPAPAQQDG